MFATAADVPPELFTRILYNLTWAAIAAADPVRRSDAKRILTKCALTCRYWASVCRPILFREITLRSLDDVHTLFGFPPAYKLHINDLSMEETAPCIPWTHIVYARVRAGDFVRNLRLSHTLDGACTPTSIQTLRSLHQSLPRRTPDLVEDNRPIHIQNYRLKEFYDLTQLVRKLWRGLGWQLRFSNVSWVEQPARVPPVLGMKIRATCDHLVVSNCPERWPFIWLMLSSSRPEVVPLGRAPFVVADEAFAVVSLVRCITTPLRRVDHTAPAVCAETTIARTLLWQARGRCQFNILVTCGEKRTCTPIAKFNFYDGQLVAIRLEFNTDPSDGCVPHDFDWEEFDALAAPCTALAGVTVVVDEGTEYTARLFAHMSARMERTYESGRLRVQYRPEDSKPRQTWVPEDAEGDASQ